MTSFISKKWFIVVLTTMGVVSSCNKSNQQANLEKKADTTEPIYSKTTTANTEQKSKEDIIFIYASKLWNDYQDNEINADLQYKKTENGGKLLIVKGIISYIKKDFLGNAIIGLQTPNMFESVIARLSDDFKKDAITMKKGQAVYFVCEGTGEIIGSPKLECFSLHAPDNDTAVISHLGKFYNVIVLSTPPPIVMTTRRSSVIIDPEPLLSPNRSAEGY
jgi:hypothetical protein